MARSTLWHLGGLTWKELARRVWREFSEDRVSGQAAQLSFYFLLSIFPLLLFMTACLGLALQANGALQDMLLHRLETLLPNSASALIQATLREVSQGSSGGKLSFGIVFSLWTASNGMVAVIEALNIAYGVAEARVWWKRRLVALVLTVVVVLLVVAALFLIIYGGRLVSWTAAEFHLGQGVTAAWRAGQGVLLVGLILLAFNILYVYGPNVKHREWHWLMPGTVVGVTLWIGASFGFKLYLRFFDRYSVTYGSIGAVIVLLLWFYLTGIAIVLGGEVNSEIENAAGAATPIAPKPSISDKPRLS